MNAMKKDSRGLYDEIEKNLVREREQVISSSSIESRKAVLLSLFIFTLYTNPVNSGRKSVSDRQKGINRGETVNYRHFYAYYRHRRRTSIKPQDETGM